MAHLTYVLIVIVALSSEWTINLCSGSILSSKPNVQVDTDVARIILDLKGKVDGKVTGKPIPIYREDLPKNYVAYSEIRMDTEFIIVSTGPETGDNELVHEGPLPTMTSELDSQAEQLGFSCYRYYMLSPGAEMMCRNTDGLVVAVTMSEHQMSNMTRKEGLKYLNSLIESRLPDLEVKWQEWADLMEHSEDEVLSIAPGDPVDIVVGNVSEVLDIVLNVVSSEEDDTSSSAEEACLCGFVVGCEIGEDGVSRINKSLIVLDPEINDDIIPLEISSAVNCEVLKGDSLLSITIFRKSEPNEKLYFNVMIQSLSRKRKRRSTREYTDWTCSETSIPVENYFPNYNQFDSNGCAVGCGPVSWAMIFGYFDRRAHYTTSYPGSKGLYRSGVDGTSGDDSEIAPSYTDDRMKGYLNKLNEELGTFCLSGEGATWMGHMDRAENFFQDRQITGNPQLTKKSWLFTWLGRYSESVCRWTRSRIGEGWPVIIGYRLDWLAGWHYPVATKYRYCTRQTRKCGGWWRGSGCGSWKTESTYDQYLHMGWGGLHDGWKEMEAFYGIAAKY